jgi:hypothetical protein
MTESLAHYFFQMYEQVKKTFDALRAWGVQQSEHSNSRASLRKAASQRFRYMKPL